MDKIPFREELFVDTVRSAMRQKPLSQEALVRHLTQKAITKRQQEFLTLYFFEGKKMVEIARLYGVNKSTVSRTIHRTLHKLRTYLDYDAFGK